MNKLAISLRAKLVPPSPIRKLVPLAQAANKKGVTVYRLEIGDPDIKSPEEIMTNINYQHLNQIPYGQSCGEENFLESLVWYYQKSRFPVEKEDIVVTQGASEAIFFAFLAICNPGDEVLVFEPFYANYQGFAKMVNVNLVSLTTFLKNGFHLPSKKKIEGKITKRTRAILLTNPNNPTGTVYTQEEISTLKDLAKKYKLFLLVDETYREFVFDNKKPFSILESLKEMPENIIVFDSLSKRYSLCGLRLGCLITKNRDVLSVITPMTQTRLSAGFLNQQIGAKIREVPFSYIEAVKKEYEDRRNVICQCLREIKGVSFVKPEGAFYILVDLPLKDSEDFVKFLLTDFQDRNETVMFAPAQGFYQTKRLGSNQVRIAYVLEKKKLIRALAILKKALEIYRVKRLLR